MTKKYFLTITPVAKPRMTHADRWNERKATGKYWAYKDELRLKANLQKYTLKDILHVTFFISTPKKERWGKPHQIKPDCDNLLKGFVDALTDHDQTIYDMHARKFWSEKAGIEIIENEE